MKGDALAVLALMLGFLTMIAAGIWAGLRDETRAEIAQVKGPLLVGAGAVGGALLVFAAA